MIELLKIPTGRPGRFPSDVNYSKLMHRHVSCKWPKAEQKEWWYLKYRAALRRKTAKLHAQQDGLCYFCKGKTFLGDDDKGDLSNRRMATADHIIPQSKGGTDHLSNLIMACAACNNLRGDMKANKFIVLRSDPERWSAYCKARQREQTARRQKVKEKRAPKQAEFMWKIALLLYLRPEWIPVAQAIQAEFARRRGLMEARNQLRRERSMVDPNDILVDATQTDARSVE